MNEKLIPYLDFKKKNMNTLIGGIVDKLVFLKISKLEIKINEHFLDLIKQKDDEFFVDINQLDKIPIDFLTDDEEKYNKFVTECKKLETQHNKIS